MTKISTKNIAEAVYKATEGKSGEDLKAVLRRSTQILSRKRLLGKSEEILQALQSILDKKNRTVRMKVISAKRIGNLEKHELAEEIKKKHKAHEVVGEFFENEDLLGGIRVEVGEEVLDNTYRNKLNKLNKFLRQEK